MAPSYSVESVTLTKSQLGEGPHWDVSRQSLYYVDILATEGTVLRYDSASDKTFAAIIGK